LAGCGDGPSPPRRHWFPDSPCGRCHGVN